MKHISLFSGIGGFDLAAEWMGWENVAHCEWNPFGREILKYYWPNAISYEDITKSDFTVHRGQVDIITGGFPCQPFSHAGKRKGKADDRYLWPEMLRVIDEVQPTWVVGENVAGLVSMVQPEIIETYLEHQTSIQDEDNEETITELQEYVTETVCRDLEQIGYSVQPFVIPACATGAPHRRDRIWFIAFRNDAANSDNETDVRGTGKDARTCRAKRLQERDEIQQPDQPDNVFRHSGNPDGLRESPVKEIPRRKQGPESYGTGEYAFADADGAMRERRSGRGQTEKRTQSGDEQPWRRDKFPRTDWQEFPTESPLCPGDDGLPDGLDIATVLKAVGRKVNKKFVAIRWWRKETIKAGGNAIVSEVAFNIFEAIESAS